MDNTQTEVEGPPQQDGEVCRKAADIRDMFDAIAPRYDFLNHFLSLGIDRRWRRKAVQQLRPASGERFLDIACGTGDVSLLLGRHLEGGPGEIIGSDFSQSMLHLARVKAGKRTPILPIRWLAAAAERLPFKTGSFDGLTVAFGVRNYADLEAGLAEMHRVLKPGGRAVILEFSLPTLAPMRWAYRLYFYYLLPLIGNWVSKHPGAYHYLPETVAAFPMREDLVDRLRSAGFGRITFKDLTFGIVTLYRASKSTGS